jgi:hypothetical protein
VCGFAPGTIVKDDDLVGGDVAHLEAAGHIARVKSGKRTDPVVEVELEDEVSE